MNPSLSIKNRDSMATPSVDAPDARSDAYSTPATCEGQRQLRALTHTAGELSGRIGVSRQTVAHWRSGMKFPGADMRRVLEETTGIPAHSWDRASTDRPARPKTPAPPRPPRWPKPSPEEAPPEPLPPHLQEVVSYVATHAVVDRRPSTMDDTNRLLDDLDADADAGDLSPSELGRIRDAKAKALALKARLEAQSEMFETAAVTKHVGWRRMRDAMLEALRPFPEAARAVAAAIQQTT